MQQFRLNCRLIFIYGLKGFIISERKKIFGYKLRTSIPWNITKSPAKNILYNLPFCGIVYVWLYAFLLPSFLPPLFYPSLFYPPHFTLRLSNALLSVNPRCNPILYTAHVCTCARPSNWNYSSCLQDDRGNREYAKGVSSYVPCQKSQ